MAKEDKIYSAAEVKDLVDTSRAALKELAALKQFLAKGEDRGTMVSKHVKTRTCSILFIDGKPVIGLENKGSLNRPLYLYDKKDPNRRDEYFLYADVLVDTGKTKKVTKTETKTDPETGEESEVEVETDEPVTEKHTLDWNEFLQQADRAECRIVDTKNIPWEIIQGKTMAKVVDESYKIEIDTEVPVVVTGFTSLLTVQLPDGRKVVIDSKYVNMAR